MAAYPLIQTNAAGALWVEDGLLKAVSAPEAEIYREKFSAVAAQLNLPFMLFQNDPEQLGLTRNNELFEQIASLQRSTLILGGNVLEGGVTQIALTCLLDGYDVFVCTDLCSTCDEPHRGVFLRRIETCGGVIITSQQAVFDAMFQDGAHSLCRSDLSRRFDKE